MKMRISVPICIIAALMLLQQGKTLLSPDSHLFHRNFANLSIVMGVHDVANLNPIHNQPERLIPIADNAYKNNISVFGAYPFSEIKSTMLTKVTLPQLKNCLLNISAIEAVPGDPRYVTLAGEVSIGGVPPQVLQLSSGGEVIGFGLTGMPTQLSKSKFISFKPNPGFKAYLLKGKVVNNQLILVGENPGCIAEIAYK